MRVDEISFTARTFTVFKALDIKTVEEVMAVPWWILYNTTVKYDAFSSGVRVNDRVLKDIEDNINRIIINN